MLINTANLEFLFQDFNMRFQAAYVSQPTFWQLFAEEMPSSSERSVHSWLAQMTGLREWVGTRQLDNVVARDYTLVNKDWEKTIGLQRNKVLDDTYGVFAKAVEMLGVQSALWPDDVSTSTLQAGTTQTCFDGQNFFDTDHPVDLDDSSKGTYSNSLSGGGTYDLAVADPTIPYNAATAAMMSVKSESTRQLNVVPDILMAPPQLRKQALQVANAEFTAQAVGAAAAGVTNVFKGDITVIINPRLSDDPTVWYLFCTSRGIKPLIFQQRQAPVLVPRISPTDPSVFDSKLFQYGVDARGAGGYSLPFLAFRMAP